MLRIDLPYIITKYAVNGNIEASSIYQKEPKNWNKTPFWRPQPKWYFVLHFFSMQPVGAPGSLQNVQR